MPIRPDLKDRYPKNWATVIRPAILERAGHRCEWCGVPNHVYRLGRTNRWTDDLGQTETWLLDGEPVTRIVLTIAHVVDVSPENCAEDNLLALCQRCHNTLDAPMRARSRRAGRRLGMACGDLFDA